MRTPRFQQLYDGCLVHMTTRCHDGVFFLEKPEVKHKYLELLGQYKDYYGVTILGYIIMDNHIHLLCKLDRAVNFSRFIMSVHSRFVEWYKGETMGETITEICKGIMSNKGIMSKIFFAVVETISLKYMANPRSFYNRNIGEGSNGGRFDRCGEISWNLSSFFYEGSCT